MEESAVMEVRIGVIYSAKELSVELDGGKAEDIVSAVEDALKGGAPVIWLTDKKGRRVGVPTAKLAYVEIGAPRSDRRVGFTPAVSTTSP
jgi:DNA-binding MurR/RpiR family transcriptional regulator